ncbi:MAG: HEAT repeat domain-containing protein [Planctomycetota bacterium]|jgi:HEAT repeat protein
MDDARIPAKATMVLLVVLVVLMAGQTLTLMSIRSRLADAERARSEAERARREAEEAREDELREAAGKLEGAAARLAAALEGPGGRGGDPIAKLVESALLLSRSSDATTRCAAARVLKGMQGERAEARLLEMARKDPSQYVRNEAVGALAECGSPQLVDILGQAWDRGGMDESARRHYVRRLKQAGNKTACKLLLYVIHHDPDSGVIKEAAEDLVQIVTRRDAMVLGKAVDVLRAKQRDRADASLTIVIEALGRMGDIRTTEHLIPCLSYDEARVAREAARALGRLQDPLAARPLVEALERTELREAVVEVLKEGYPGVRRDGGDAFALVDDDELNRLLAERKEKIERRLEEIKELDKAVDIF